MNEQALDYKMQGFAMMGVEKFDKAVELFSKSIEIEQNSDYLRPPQNVMVFLLF